MIPQQLLTLLAGRRLRPGHALLYSGALADGAIELGVSEHPFLFLQNRTLPRRTKVGLEYNEWDLASLFGLNQHELTEYGFSPGRLFPVGNSDFYRNGENYYAYAAQSGPSLLDTFEVAGPSGDTGLHALGEEPVAYLLCRAVTEAQGLGFAPRFGFMGHGEFVLINDGPVTRAFTTNVFSLLNSTSWDITGSFWAGGGLGRAVVFGSNLAHASAPSPGSKVTTGWRPELVLWLSENSPGHWMVHSRLRDTANNENDASKSISGAATGTGTRTDNLITWHDDGYTFSVATVSDTRYDTSFNSRVLAFRSFE